MLGIPLKFKTVFTEAGETGGGAGWVSLWCKHEDLSSNPENMFTKLTVIMLNACDLSDGELRRENEWGLLGASLAQVWWETLS